MGLSSRIKRRTFWCPAAEREVTALAGGRSGMITG